MEAKDVIELLELEPLPDEGGYFRSTYKAKRGMRVRLGDQEVERAFGTAIYYLITPKDFSALHRLLQDELFHFYAGDAAEQIRIGSAGKLETEILGIDFEQNERPQTLVPAGVWQGTRVRAGGRWSLLGSTVCPGFEFDDFELASRDALTVAFPVHAELIRELTR